MSEDEHISVQMVQVLLCTHFFVSMNTITCGFLASKDYGFLTEYKLMFLFKRARKYNVHQHFSLVPPGFLSDK